MTKTSCSIVTCPRHATSLGYCSQHYYRFKKYGDPLYNAPNCNYTESECKRKGRADLNGLCPAHAKMLGVERKVVEQAPKKIRAGFWREYPLVESKLPYPKPSRDANWMIVQPTFVLRLMALQFQAVQNKEAKCVTAKTCVLFRNLHLQDKGCLLCGKPVSKATFACGEVAWQASFLHYIEEHAVKPKLNFYNFVLDATHKYMAPTRMERKFLYIKQGTEFESITSSEESVVHVSH